MKSKETYGIGKRIKYYRHMLNMSQDYVANYLEINRATYSQLENGIRKATVEYVIKLSALFGVSANTLLYGNSNETPLMLFISEFGLLNEEEREDVMSYIRSLKEKRGEN